jgi:ubiquitin-protein ligase E3 C
LWSFVVHELTFELRLDAAAAVALEAPLNGVDVALGNVLQLAKAFVGTMDFSQAQDVVVAATKLMESSSLSAALFTTTPNAMEDEEDNEGGADDDDEDDSVKVDLLNLRAVRAEARKLRRVPPDVNLEAVRVTRTWMQVREFFGDSTCIARLANAVTAMNDAHRSSLGIEAFTHFVCACNMVLRGAERTSFTRVLTFGTDSISRLWNALESWKAASERGQQRSFRRALSVFVTFYNTYTAISDDEEFYRLGKPLGLKATTCLVALLRDTLWTLLWVERGPDGSPLNSLSFMDEYFEAETWHACSKALARLHDLNGRHQFMDPVAFQVRDTQVDIPILLQEARDTKSRASMLLCGAPCLVPFEVRVHKFMDVRRRERQMGAVGYATIRVRRGHLLEDGIASLSDKLTETLGGIIRVQFINQQGLEEAGVDGGGLFKDFLNDLIAEAFDPKFGLFVETPERTLYPNPASELHAGERHLQYFYFLGAILGKACYDGILLDVPLAGFLLASLKGRHIEFNDLTTLDPELYRNLVSLKRYEGDVQDLCLYFTAIDRSGMEETEIELIPNGSSVPVTKANVPQYLRCMSIYLLRAQIYRQLSSMKAGFSIAMRKRWLDMFTPAELRLLISGNRTGSMDIDDMAANCEYSGGYDASHPTIRSLWRVMRSIPPDDQRLVLKFITSCSNTPLLGFSHLEPKLCVHRSGTAGTEASDTTADLSRLPTAATCMNLLKLPPYSSDEALREKLMYAVKSGSGFDLS